MQARWFSVQTGLFNNEESDSLFLGVDNSLSDGERLSNNEDNVIYTNNDGDCSIRVSSFVSE